MTQTETVTEANIKADISRGIELLESHSGGGELIFPVKISSLDQDEIVMGYLGQLKYCVAKGFYVNNWSYELPESIEEGEVYGLAIRVNFLDITAVPDMETLSTIVKKLYKRHLETRDDIEMLRSQVCGLQSQVMGLEVRQNEKA